MRTVPSGLPGELHSISEASEGGSHSAQNQVQQEAKWFFTKPQI
jgi:hypothetical protein